MGRHRRATFELSDAAGVISVYRGQDVAFFARILAGDRTNWCIRLNDSGMRQQMARMRRCQDWRDSLQVRVIYQAADAHHH